MTLREGGRARDILFPLLEGVESESVSDEYVNAGGKGRGASCMLLLCSSAVMSMSASGFLFHLHF